jgi:hypothetical protein
VSEEGPVHARGGTRGEKIVSVGPWLLGIGGAAAVTTLATWLAVRDNSGGRLSLDVLRPTVKIVVSFGEWLLQDPQPWLTRVGALVAILALAVGGWLWRRRRDAEAIEFGPILIAVGLAFIAQLFIFHGRSVAGGLGYTAAVAVVVVCSLAARRPARDLFAEERGAPLKWREAVVFLAIVGVAVFFRYYALNRILNFFEGELACFMAAATDLHGMLLANIGWDGPWAPMGILFYLPIWAMTAIGGSTVLAVRMGSAVVGVLTLVVVYVVVRDAIGRAPALWSAALVSVDTLQIGWGRSDMHPHASTAWPGVLLYGATVRALTTGATGWYVAVMLLMGLSWHQYPSGQFVVIVPVIALIVHAIQNPGFLRTSWRKAALVVTGGVLWVLGYPLAYLLAVGKVVTPVEYIARLGPRVIGGSDQVTYAGISITDFVVTTSYSIWDLIRGLFVEPPYIFHQTVIPEVEGLPPRALPWFVAACAVVGLAICCVRIRERWSPPLLALVAAGVLPAILSDAAWLKRASLLYLALIIVAAVPLAIITSHLSRMLDRRLRWVGAGILVVAFLLWSSIWVALWFSGRQYPYGVSAEETILNTLDPYLEPDTLLVFCLWGDYIEGELVYLVSDALRSRQPIALYITSHYNADWPVLLAHPKEMVTKIEPYFWYWNWLGLDDELPKLRQYQDWSRVVYLIEHRPGVESDFEILAESCPDLEIEGVFVGDDAEERNGVTLKRYHVWIARCDHHRDLESVETVAVAKPGDDQDEDRQTG